jgi:hypothetical protein
VGREQQFVNGQDRSSGNPGWFRLRLPGHFASSRSAFRYLPMTR